MTSLRASAGDSSPSPSSRSSSWRLSSSSDAGAATSPRDSDGSGDRSGRGLQDVPDPPRAADVLQGVLPASVSSSELRAERRSQRRRVLRRGGGGLRGGPAGR